MKKFQNKRQNFKNQIEEEEKIEVEEEKSYEK